MTSVTPAPEAAGAQYWTCKRKRGNNECTLTSFTADATFLWMTRKVRDHSTLTTCEGNIGAKYIVVVLGVVCHLQGGGPGTTGQRQASKKR